MTLAPAPMTRYGTTIASDTIAVAATVRTAAHAGFIAEPFQAPTTTTGRRKTACALVKHATAINAPARIGAPMTAAATLATAGKAINGSRYPSTAPFRTLAGFAQYAIAAHRDAAGPYRRSART
jgi:hypothetical protein